MLRPRWKKVLSDLWSNKIRSLLVIASITVGLFAVGMITSMHIIVRADLETGYRAVNPANILIQTQPFDEELLHHIRHLEGVRQAEGVASLTLRVRSPSGDWKPLEVQAIPDLGKGGMQINRVQLEEGTWPPVRRQIVVDDHKLEDLPGGVGDYIEVELPSGKTRQMKVAGVVNDQTIGMSGAGGFFLAPVQGYITLDTLEWLEYPEKMNLVYITVSGDANDTDWLRQVANRVSRAIEDSGRSIYQSSIRAANDHPNRVYVEALTAILVLLGFLVMFLSGFLITNTLSALLNQQEHQIGVMKTIGARRGQIMGIYMVLIFVFGITAFTIAMPLSSQAAYFLLELFASAINMQLQGFRVVPEAVVLQLIIALIVPQAAAFLPIWHGTRISAVEALSGYSQAHPPKVHRWQGSHRIPRPLLLSLRNTFRRRGRLALTLFTLTLAGAIFIATFNVQRSLTSYIARIGQYFAADVNLSLQNSYRIREIRQALETVPGVGEVEGWAASTGELVMPDGSSGESINLLAPPSTSRLVKANVMEGRWVEPGDVEVIAVNERFRESFPHLKVGDTLRVKIAGETHSLKVIGFFRLAGKSGGYLGYTTYEFLSLATHEPNQARAYRISASRSGLTLEEQEALGRAIETRMEAAGYAVAEVTAGKSLTATTADGLNILTFFLLIMALLIAIVGSIGLTGTMSLNVLERTREIGILRSIGASDRSVMSMVMVEGVLIGAMSWFLGTLVAFPMSTIMSNAINLALFGAAAEFTFTSTGFILWLGVVVVLSVLASAGPARNATRLTIREVLSYE